MIWEDLPEVGAPEIMRQIGRSLRTKGYEMKWLPVSRGGTKKWDPVSGHRSCEQD